MTTSPVHHVLISGAGIAGAALAHWLRRYGFAVTVVERAPALRPGGQAVDVRGPALEVADRMGLLGALREHGTGQLGMTVVAPDGTEVYRTEEHTLTGGAVDSPDVEIMRDDLSRLLAESCLPGIAYRWDDTVTALTEDGDGVRATFERSAPATFDLVVGADGLHSAVRRLAFGEESRFIRHLGTYLAVFTTPNFLGLDHWQVFMQGTDTGGGVMSARGNTEARAYLGFAAPEPLAYDVRDTAAQKRLVAERLAGAGWEVPTCLEHMWDAPDFHFDSMSQIQLDSWSRGRVTLLGDAGYCGSPLSGQGTSMALVGAYVLAGELKAARGDHRAALAAYESALRPWVTANQRLALTNKDRMEAQTAAATGDTAAAERLAALEIEDFTSVVAGVALPDY